MKKLFLKNKRRRFNNKKGLSLLELIIAVMILMITVSLSVNALNISYRSVLVGAERDDAQSIAQRDCDIIMSIISRQAENGTITSSIDASGSKFEDTFFNTVKADTDLNVYSSSYDVSQYGDLEQQTGSLTADNTVKKRYVKIEKDAVNRTIGIKTFAVYKVTTSVYYGTGNDGMYVSCEGEVNVEI